MKTDRLIKNRVYIAGLTSLFALIFLFSFSVGKYPVTPGELLHVIAGKFMGSVKDWSNEVELVIFKIRMPRILAGALIGAGLSAAGAAYQGLFRNPMISPDLLGASSGAGFGAAISLFLGLGYTFTMVNSFVCGIVAVVLAFAVGMRVRQNQVFGMVLAGIMVSSLFNSATSFIKLVADPNNVLPAITYWLMGSIAGVTTEELSFAAFPAILGMLILLVLRWKINLITMGEEEARSMGINTKLLRILVILAATLVTAACVSISGLIGWVGLVIPHFARLLVGYDYRIMLPSSMLMGASFLIVVDGFSRMIATSEIPIGVLTAFIGAPLFVYLILKKGGTL